MTVFITICIPAYKRTSFLKRLLDSIAIQTYDSFEVIVTDDSTTEEVKTLVQTYNNKIPNLQYYQNTPALGMPANWNKAITYAKGKWIKIMHDDDWFATENALEKFAVFAQSNDNTLIFSAYNNVFFSKNQIIPVFPSAFRLEQLYKNPVTLLSLNIIGPPSVVMHRNDGTVNYDNKLKWLVDIDMYIQRMRSNTMAYLPEVLINVGMGDEQVTAEVHGAPEVEIPEHFYFLQKTGIGKLNNILIYDYWWRFVRNFQLTSQKIYEYGKVEIIHPCIQSMINWQRFLPKNLLKMGPFSKTFMAIHYLIHKRLLKK